jgi:hypothetical protein
MKENKFYIYAYLDPRKPGKYMYGKYEFDYEPFYVGKGSGYRLNNHLYESVQKKSSNKHKINKIKKINKELGVNPIVLKLIDGLSEDDAFNAEINYINSIGRLDISSGPLTNLTNGGGKSFNCSEETKEKLRKANIGKKLSSITKQKISISKTGKISPKKGIKTNKITSYETKKKISEALIGKKHLLESIEKMKIIRTGKRFSKEVKEKMSETRKGKNLKTFKITNPADEIFYTTQGLVKFCELNNLNQSAMSNVARGRINNHKGWRCEYFN